MYAFQASAITRLADLDQDLGRARIDMQALVVWATLVASGALLALLCIRTLRAALREEAALRARQESDLRFRQLAENIGEVFWLRDIDQGTVLFISSACRTLWGRSPEELMGGREPWPAAVHADDAGRMRALAGCSGRRYDEEYRIVRPDGSIRWVRERTFPVHDADGRVYRTAGVAEDITQRKLAESSRAASERRLRDIIDLVPHLIYAKDADGRLVMANRTFSALVGREPQDMLGHGLEHFGIDAAHAAEMNLQDRRLLASGERIEGALMDRRMRGEQRSFMVNKMPFRFHDERLDSVLVVATDVTGLRRIETELKQTVALLEATLESTDNGVMVSDAQGSLLLWNQRLADLLPSRAPLESRAESEVLAALAIEPRGRVGSDVVVHRPDGSYLEYRIQPMRIDGSPAGFVWSFRDVSDRELAAFQALQREHELEARVSERTRELAQAYQELESFSHAVSHDLRAPLAAIHAFLHVLLVRHGSRVDPEVRHLVEQVQGAAQRMREMIAGLLELSTHAQAPARREPLDLTGMARAAYELHAQATSGRRIEFRVQEGLRARGDPALVGTLLQNLIGNAVKYSSRRDPARIEVLAETGDVARFCVRDNGAGFDPAHAGQLFKPFSRLHSSEDFPGHGIGLATAARIVARHGGQIGAEAAPDGGASFWFTLG